jgi:DNA-binding transcriptional LysR family regulator
MTNSDLNLLVHFDALMTTRSVSKAGQQLGISQPAMSSALSRLRYLFNDPLLVREGNRWTVTDRARTLHEAFQPLLQEWQEATSAQAPFDPASTQRSFNLYATDYVQFTVLTRVMQRVKAEAPRLQLRVLPPKLAGGLDMLAGGHVELYIGHYPQPPESLRTRFLFEESSCSLVRRDHPCLAAPWDLDGFLAYEHMDASGYAGYFNAQIDAALEGLDRRRTVGAVLSSYLAVPFVLASTDMISTLPHSVAVPLCPVAGTIMLSTPIHLPPLSIALYWHERYQNDPAHTWLRQCIASVFEAQPPAAD